MCGRKKTNDLKEMKKGNGRNTKTNAPHKAIAGLCAAFVVISTLAFATPVSAASVIHDSNGHSWSPTGSNLVAAFKALQTNTELWIPAGTYSVSSGNLAITKNGVKIHGSGSSTVISFSNGARLISGLYASSTTDSQRYKYGVNNLLLENFKITGNGCIEIVVGDNTRLQGIDATNIAASRPAAFRFILPTNDHTSSGLVVRDCHTYRTRAHGFQINGVAPNGYNTISNVLFDNCSASWAGFTPSGKPSGNLWSTGFDLGEGYSDCDVNTPSTMVQYCSADHNWECGFHIETAVKRSLTFNHCTANYNGQKRIYQPSAKQYFSSGFVAESGTKLYHCTASGNTNFGVMNRGSPVIVSFAGSGNWNGLRRQ
jgi:hypothetical protein